MGAVNDACVSAKSLCGRKLEEEHENIKNEESSLLQQMEYFLNTLISSLCKDQSEKTD